MLQHVTLEVRPDQVDECLRFWSVLGFERIDAPPLLRDRFVWVARGATQIHLMPLEDPVTTSQGHAAVVVDDYDAARTAIEALGAQTRDGRNAWNAPRFFARDPAGNQSKTVGGP